MKKPILERIEDLTAELYGLGAAVSVTEQGGTCTVECWSRDGKQSIQSVSRKRKVFALEAMETQLMMERRHKDKEESHDAE
jgi:hypothetical protein